MTASGDFREREFSGSVGCTATYFINPDDGVGFSGNRYRGLGTNYRCKEKQQRGNNN
jgi:hypothetical protein